jgi:lysophospholipase L1-like esterase
MHLRWLPLGDSITWGCGNGILPHVAGGGCERDAGSYRIPAAMALEQWNITVDTVGSLTAGPASAPDKWTHHEGHPGWTAPQITAIAGKWTLLRPDMITILLGTNDCGNVSRAGADPAFVVESMRALLATITEALPAVKVFVASILAMPSDSHGGDDAKCGVNYNAALPSLLAANPNFFYVPLFENTSSPLVCGDNRQEYSIGDGIHPNTFGHLRVASVFARTIADSYCPNHRNDQSC